MIDEEMCYVGFFWRDWFGIGLVFVVGLYCIGVGNWCLLVVCIDYYVFL